MQNKNAFLLKPQGEEFASKSLTNTKFDSVGGIGSIEVEPGSFVRSQEESVDEAEEPGKVEHRIATAGVSKAARQRVGASPPNRNEHLTNGAPPPNTNRFPTDGAISAPPADPSGVSPDKLLLPDASEELHAAEES